MILTAYGNKGIPIPMFEGISFVDAGVQFGTVQHFEMNKILSLKLANCVQRASRIMSSDP